MIIEPLDYIWTALVMTFCTLSFYSLTREGQLLGWLRSGFSNILHAILNQICPCTKEFHTIKKFILKPLFECPPCMASVWGSTFYWSIFGADVKTWIICVLISSILNKIIYGYVE